MASDVTICSNALLLIGHNKISALSENEQAEAFYPTTYEDQLSQHKWKFATRKVALSQLTAQPLNEFKYAYQLPSDFLILDRTYPSSTYKIFGDKLYSNNNEVEIDYRFRVSEGDLPAYFVTMMEFQLAAKFAIPVTSNKGTADTYFEQYKDQRIIAKFLDSQSAPQDAINDNPFTDVRAGGMDGYGQNFNK